MKILLRRRDGIFAQNLIVFYSTCRLQYENRKVIFESDYCWYEGDFREIGSTVERHLLQDPEKAAQFIMGNHEYMFFKFYNSLMQSESCDYDAVLRRLQQYFPEDGDLGCFCTDTCQMFYVKK